MAPLDCSATSRDFSLSISEDTLGFFSYMNLPWMRISVNSTLHQPSSKKIFLIDDTDKAELLSTFFAKHLVTE
nr:unnamed protein product [Spirometra erinaceieuropaei]